jgi:predicted acylesterase/phospholipase RssA
VKYDLVFEGGGAKGMVFVGACQVLFDRGHTFGRLLGTSAGAITATLLAAGYSSREMLDALTENGPDGKSVFTGFMGPPTPFSQQELQESATRRLLDGVDFTFLPDFIERKSHEKLLAALATNDSFRHVLALVERGGWFAADRFIEWLTAKLNSGSFNGRPRAFSAMSFAQFFEATGVELSLVASDTTDGQILVLNHRTAPDCPIVWGVRMSMSIPLVWNEVIWQESWGRYLGAEMTDHAIVDGGLLSNFPIELFVSDAPQVTRLMGPKSGNSVLGMLIDEKLATTKGLFVRISIKPGELRTVQRIKRLADTATGAHDKMVMDENKPLVVRLPAQGYGTTEFDMSEERRNALVAAGREAMDLYLDAPPAGLVLPSKAAPAGPRDTSMSADRIALGILGARAPADPEEGNMPVIERTAASEAGNSSARQPIALPGTPEFAKLPFPTPPQGYGSLPAELKTAWTEYMVNGFHQNEQMFKTTLGAFMKPYRLTVWLYGALFALGIGLFVVAVILGLTRGSSAVTIAFAGLSVTTFLTFFLRQPMRALEENLEFITWLGVAFNTYWTRLMYLTDAKTIQQELKAADSDFVSSVEKLIERHAKLREARTADK